MNPGQLSGGSLGRQDTLRAAGPFVVSATQHERGFASLPHVHERACLNVVLAGAYGETTRGRSILAAPNTFVAKPAWESHANDFRHAGARCLLVEVSTAESGLVQDVTSLFAMPAEMPCESLRAIVRRILDELRRSDDASTLAIEELSYELVRAASCRRQANEERRPDAWLARIRAMIEALPTVNYSLALLGAEVGRHPAHVARAFMRRHGCTVSAFVRQVRVQRAAVLLHTTSLSTSTIAHEVGFYDHPHFCRAFRARTGMTPSEYRATQF